MSKRFLENIFVNIAIHKLFSFLKRTPNTCGCQHGCCQIDFHRKIRMRREWERARQKSYFKEQRHHLLREAIVQKIPFFYEILS